MGKKEDEFLSNFNPEIRLLIDELSGIIFQTFPNIKEKILSGMKGLAYTDTKFGHLFDIIPTKEFIKLSFENGHSMTDKHNLFSEETKKVKCVIIKSHKDIIKNKSKIIEYLIESVELKQKN